MSAPAAPRPGLYYPKLPRTWWLRHPAYFRFMMRELSSVFVAAFLGVLLAQLYHLSRGPEAFAAFLAQLRSPGWIAFHVIALGFAVYHTVTWFGATAVVQVVRIGGRQVPPPLVTAANYAVWAAVSLGVLVWFARI
ncbi:MAG TPA: fumarate reductase subunit C [Thermodesulfobacteriota bacterium]|nr:fumarate reductase subunit C [Thermodesulfobacteriota bacterium]